VLHRKELAASDDPVRLRARLVADYTAELMDPQYAAERGLVDDVIDPVDTRGEILRGLAMVRDKRRDVPRRKHSNMPI
jgi:acetyl-CoA carboxylase carboxyltransferase component